MENYIWVKRILEQENEQMTDKQKAIIKAAVELFSEKGYASTSTREIAQRAEVAEGTIFKHYETKKELMLWITHRIIDTALLPLLSSGISELISKPFDSREDFLTAFFQNRMELFHEIVPMFRIILQEAPFHPEIRIMLIEQLQKMPLSRIVEKIIDEENSDFSAAEIMQLLLPCIVGFFFSRNIMLPEFFSGSDLQKDVAVFVRFLNKGFSKKTEGERI